MSKVRILDVDVRVLAQAIKALPYSFNTKDVSESDLMLDHHAGIAYFDRYHQVVGSALSRNRGELGLKLMTFRSAKRGARWMKLAAELGN